MANVEARVSGLIEEAPFREGSVVQKGALLFVIDPRPFQADVDAKKASVQQAQSQADEADVHLRRLAKVRGTQAVSEDDYDAAKAAYDQALAALSAAKAALESSDLNLQWTRVTAPIAGRISHEYVEPGNLVTGGNGAGTPTLLTTINSVNPLYCYIPVPDAVALRVQGMVVQRGGDIARADISCFIELPDESTFSHRGVIDFIDNHVDTSTGTVQVRGVVPNPNNLMLPGLNVRVRIPGGPPYQAILIQDAAINTDQNEQYVLIVDKDDIARRQPIQLGAQFGDLRAIAHGLTPGQRVIVNGIQKVRAGQKVNPHEVPLPTQTLNEIESTGSGLASTRPAPATGPTSRPAEVPATAPAIGEGR
jgi:RND family efflux transporter MFP subunit